MKRKITMLFFAAAGALSINAQVLLNESFTPTFVPSSNGWVVQNNSVPIGTASWFQGNANVFPANSGAPNAYFGVNYQSQGSTIGGISNWLMTPTVTIQNGAIFTFATRTGTSGPGTYPDRLQLRMSTMGTSTAVGTGTAAVGDFTTLLEDVNPNLTTTGYPASWTVYSATITGITGTVSGRFAFRYFVDDGGLNGNNSDYIGIDDVTYSLPCGATVQSYTTCPGTTATLNAVGGLGTTTYSWSTGATTSSITVSPSSTTVYSLTSFYPGGTCPTVQEATVTIDTQMNVAAATSASAICSGSSATLTASSAASTYTWVNTMQSGAQIVVMPTANTIYTVVGQNGACFGGATVAVNVNPSPTVSANSSSLTVCTGQQFTLTGSGSATSYTWAVGAQQFTTNPIALSSTAAAVYNFTLTGSNASGCKASAVLSQTITTCTGINEVTGATIVSVFPNPFANELTVSGVYGKVDIYNTLGQLVSTSAVLSENQKINTSDLTKGVYIVKAFDSEGREVKNDPSDQKLKKSFSIH